MSAGSRDARFIFAVEVIVSDHVTNDRCPRYTLGGPGPYELPTDRRLLRARRSASKSNYAPV